MRDDVHPTANARATPAPGWPAPTIQKSHERSETFGLQASARPDYDLLSGTALALKREQSRVLCVHALEESDDPAELLREVCRVLAPSGRVIVAVAARNGLWSNAEHTPFGHGRPFTRRQLEALLREADLEPSGWTRALYAPPFAWCAGWAEGFEQAGAWLWPNFAGLILMEAVKQTFAVKPRGSRARVRVFAPGSLAPAPVGAGMTREGFDNAPPPPTSSARPPHPWDPDR